MYPSEKNIKYFLSMSYQGMKQFQYEAKTSKSEGKRYSRDGDTMIDTHLYRYHDHHLLLIISLIFYKKILKKKENSVKAKKNEM